MTSFPVPKMDHNFIPVRKLSSCRKLPGTSGYVDHATFSFAPSHRIRLSAIRDNPASSMCGLRHAARLGPCVPAPATVAWRAGTDQGALGRVHGDMASPTGFDAQDVKTGQLADPAALTLMFCHRRPPRQGPDHRGFRGHACLPECCPRSTAPAVRRFHPAKAPPECS